MATWVITGKLGGGKSLVSVSRIMQALIDGKKIATNLDLNIDKMFSKYSKASYIRIPDKPTAFDMESIGIGNESYDEEKNGLIVLDELGTWLNSRSWQDKSRRPLLDWFLHARKKGWDIIFIVQDVGMIDSQFRDSLAEMTAFCRRLDRMSIPFIGFFYKQITGKPLPLPKVHFARVVYGISPTDMVIDRWVYRGTDLYDAYDTRQIFQDARTYGAHSLLPPYYLNYRLQSKKTWGNFMRQTKILWKRFRSPIALGTGVLLGSALAMIIFFKGKYDNYQPRIKPIDAAQEVDFSEDTYTVRLKDFISTLYISGSSTINGKTQFELADINDPNSRVYYTDMDLAMMGLTVRRKGDCRLDVLISGDTYPLFCMPKLINF